MATIKLKNVEQFRDRYGKQRFYFRIGKGARVALKGDPGSDEFNASYAAAIGKAKTQSQHDRSFNALAKVYYRSVKFLKWKESSKAVTRGILDRFLAEHGHRLVAQMKSSDVDRLLAEKAATPAAANNFLKKLRVLLKLAIKLEWIDRDPTVGADQFKSGTHHTWTEAEIAKFEQRWPLGSRERVAFDLQLYTGQRRGDVCAMTYAQILPGNLIAVKQEKGGKELVIPMHSSLVRSLNLWAGGISAIVSQQNGKRYTVESYGNLMADAIDKAGLPARCVLHGLRKAAARRLAEAGCSAHQIAAITGHDSLEEIERYTKAASQAVMAGQAIESLGRFKKA